MNSFQQFMDVNKLMEFLKQVGGAGSAYMFDGPEDSGHIHRNRQGKLVWGNNDYDQEFESDRTAAEWLIKRRYKFVGVDSLDDEEG